MITAKYWSQNSIANKIILAMCNDMLINEFLYDVDDTDAYEYYNECIYKSFNAGIKIIEDWVNNNNVSKVHIWATNKTYDEHAYNVDGYIEDAKYQEFMKTCSLTNYFYGNDVEIGYNEHILGIGVGSYINLYIERV